MTVNPAALQLYTLREQLSADRPGVLAQVAALGYGAVEPFDILSDPDGLRADLDAAGLFACSVHAVPAGEQAEDVVRAARTLGADTIIIPYLPPPRFADADGVQGVARELNELAAWMAGQDLRLGYHNHDFEFSSLVGGVPALRCSRINWTTRCCSRSIPTGRRWAARTCPPCSAGSATGSATCTSRTARWSTGTTS